MRNGNEMVSINKEGNQERKKIYRRYTKKKERAKENYKRREGRMRNGKRRNDKKKKQ